LSMLTLQYVALDHTVKLTGHLLSMLTLQYVTLDHTAAQTTHSHQH